ncbi:hypothetical protein L2E82_45517 [Cichorium intybus]|uniref:Uncharacterized protein n=1 Tax=Cichorium intybus TaxID=13427 RepID=A0ACB8ZTR9_CICIN|nr:hypothetical protein L2E82_45517 [Cichorium intybus]
MASRTLRGRLHHGDVGGKKHEHLTGADFDDLNEPLLGNNDNNKTNRLEVQNIENILYDEKRKENLHWGFLFCRIISEWAQWLVLLGSRSFIARILTLPSTAGNGSTKKFLPPLLSPLQGALRHLWRSGYPNRELPGLKSEVWKEMGWQRSDPSTDFRGGGFISLENLIFFAKRYPEAF